MGVNGGRVGFEEDVGRRTSRDVDKSVSRAAGGRGEVPGGGVRVGRRGVGRLRGESGIGWGCTRLAMRLEEGR